MPMEGQGASAGHGRSRCFFLLTRPLATALGHGGEEFGPDLPGRSYSGAANTRSRVGLAPARAGTFDASVGRRSPAERRFKSAVLYLSDRHVIHSPSAAAPGQQPLMAHGLPCDLPTWPSSRESSAC